MNCKSMRQLVLGFNSWPSLSKQGGHPLAWLIGVCGSYIMEGRERGLIWVVSSLSIVSVMRQRDAITVTV